MKLIYIAVLLLVTTFSYTQNNNANPYAGHTNSLLIEYFKSRVVNKNLGILGICSEMRTSSDFKLKSKSLSLTTQLDSVYKWDWDIHATDWKPIIRYIEMEYSANNLQSSYIEQMLTNNLWVNYAKHQYSFDLAGNMVSYVEQRWEGNKWVNFSKTTNTYNLQNDPLNNLEQKWDVNVWQNVSSTDYSYDANNNIITELLKKWEGTEWVNDTKATYTYDSNNLLTCITIQGYNGTWVNVIKGDFTYNADNMISNEYDFIWDGINWTNYVWYNYKYDANKRLTKELIKIWDNTIWNNYERSNISYDANNNMTFWLKERSFEADWLTYSQYSCEYNANNLITSESNKFWDVTGTEIINGEKYTYYFHAGSSGRTDQSIDKIIVFPNPSNGKFAIQSLPANSSIEVYMMNGERIYSASKSKNQEDDVIDLTRYSDGVYLLKVKIGSETHGKSIIIQ